MYDLENDRIEVDNLANPAHARYYDPFIPAERERLHQKLLLLLLEKEKLGSMITQRSEAV